MKTLLEIISGKNGSNIDEMRKLDSQIKELPLAQIHQWLIPSYDNASDIQFRNFISATKKVAVDYEKSHKLRGKGYHHSFTFIDGSVLTETEYSSSYIEFS